jgi:hypothetical protein
MATITVRGTGTALGTPDEATVGLGSETLRPLPRPSRSWPSRR